jgi:hypothetical protein
MQFPTKNIYRNDLILQGLVFLPMIFCYILGFLEIRFYFFGVLLQFLVGSIQLGSGTYYVLKFQDKFHKKYLSIALIYIVNLFLVCNIFDLPSFILIIILFIIPTAIGSWYFYRTWENHKNAQRYSIKEFQEDILDDIIF